MSLCYPALARPEEKRSKTRARFSKSSAEKRSSRHRPVNLTGREERRKGEKKGGNEKAPSHFSRPSEIRPVKGSGLELHTNYPAFGRACVSTQVRWPVCNGPFEAEATLLVSLSMTLTPSGRPRKAVGTTDGGRGIIRSREKIEAVMG